MTEKEKIIGNETIAEFLGWEVNITPEVITYFVPNNFTIDTGYIEWAVDSLNFDVDWNWFQFAWQEYLRKVAVPVIRDNPKLRYIRPLLQKTKKAIVWGHIDTAYECLVELIKTYNNLFNEC